MKETPRRKRARLWAWVYAAVFDPDEGPDTGTRGDEGRDEDAADGDTARDPLDPG